MEKSLRQPEVMDCRSGASGAIDVEALALAAPDGYAIGLIALIGSVQRKGTAALVNPDGE